MDLIESVSCLQTAQETGSSLHAVSRHIKSCPVGCSLHVTVKQLETMPWRLLHFLETRRLL